MDNQDFFTSHLQQGLEELQIPFTQDQIDLCYHFFIEYSAQSKILNISTISDPKDFIEKHILDSIAPYHFLKNIKELADLGSGGGFPGIILGIFLPHTSITLIDVIEKKVQYLSHIIKKFHLSHLTTVNTTTTKIQTKFDVITARAVASLSKLVVYCKPFSHQTTKLFAYKAKRETIDTEISVLKKKYPIIIHPLSVPFLEAERHLVILEKIKS